MIRLGSLQIANPIVASSGALAYGRAYGWERPLITAGIIKPQIIGAVITKSLTLHPRIGNYKGWNPWQVLSPIKGGWVNAFGLTNPGIDWFIQSEYPQIYHHNLVVSIYGENSENLIAMVKKLNGIKCLAVEINLSCPNTKNCALWQHDFELTRKTMMAAKLSSNHPIIAKIGYLDEKSRVEINKAFETAGIDAVDMINTIPFKDLCPERKSPLSFGGGISGSVIKEYALDQVRWFYQNSRLPVIGGGGVVNIHDLDDFLAAGASAVSIGSAHIMRPWITTKMVKKYYRKINN